MKTEILLIVMMVFSVIAYSQDDQMASSDELESWIAKDKELTRAKLDEMVLIVLVKIKPELKQEFDQWIKEILYAALYNSKSQMKQAQLKATRWLEPVEENADGTWTYSWIMDPVIPRTNYDIPKFLNMEYGEELGAKHWEKYQTFLAEPPQPIFLKQTDY